MLSVSYLQVSGENSGIIYCFNLKKKCYVPSHMLSSFGFLFLFGILYLNHFIFDHVLRQSQAFCYYSYFCFISLIASLTVILW